MKIIKKLSSTGMSVANIADVVGLTETEITKILDEKIETKDFTKM